MGQELQALDGELGWRQLPTGEHLEPGHPAGPEQQRGTGSGTMAHGGGFRHFPLRRGRRNKTLPGLFSIPKLGASAR